MKIRYPVELKCCQEQMKGQISSKDFLYIIFQIKFFVNHQQEIALNNERNMLSIMLLCPSSSSNCKVLQIIQIFHVRRIADNPICRANKTDEHEQFVTLVL